MPGWCPQHKRPCAEVHGDNTGNADVFLAYPGRPPSISDALYGLGRRLREDPELHVSVSDWQDLDIEGGHIFCEICRAIRASSCVLADITGLNFNVMFELGFAVGLGKVVWPLVQEGLADTLPYKKLDALTTLGHVAYRNSAQLHKKIQKKDTKPWNRPSQFGQIGEIPKPTPPALLGLFYVKSDYDDEASLRVSEMIHSLNVATVVDDPSEDSSRSLADYHRFVSEKSHVVLDLGSRSNAESSIHRARCALVAGMAIASGRNLQILAGAGTESAVDYHDLVTKYRTAAEAEDRCRKFLEPLAAEIRTRRTGADAARWVNLRPGASPLARINLGDYVAENEVSGLRRYFLETQAFRSVYVPGSHLLVGRKGTGKSAIAAELFARLRDDPKRVVVQFVPKHYELDAMLQFIQSVSELHAQEHLLESIWKYVILTEILVSISGRIKELPVYASLTRHQRAVSDFLERNQATMDMPFSYRVLKVLEDEQATRDHKVAGPANLPVSERLHSAVLGRLQSLILDYFVGERLSVSLIADGLDGNWLNASDRLLMSRILLSLIGAGAEVWRKLSGRLGASTDHLDCHLVIMMRSDIFRGVRDVAAERDKLGEIVIAWEHEDAILGVVGRRIGDSLAAGGTEWLDWDSILAPPFNYAGLRKLFRDRSILRPRDAIFWFQRALNHAAGNQETRLAESDFTDTEGQYSEYAVNAICAEWHPAVADMTTLVYECFGEGPREMSESELHASLCSRGGVDLARVKEVVQFLVDTAFLGVATDGNDFRYATSPGTATLLYNRVLRSSKSRKYQVHSAYRRALAVR